MDVMTLDLGTVEFSVENEYQEFWTYMPFLDKKWRYVDKKRHKHSAKNLEETLKWVITLKGSDEYPDEGEYRCRKCKEVIEPGTIVDTSPKRIHIGTHFFINHEEVDVETMQNLKRRMKREGKI